MGPLRGAEVLGRDMRGEAFDVVFSHARRIGCWVRETLDQGRLRGKESRLTISKV